MRLALFRCTGFSGCSLRTCAAALPDRVAPGQQLLRAPIANLHYLTGDGKLASLGEAAHDATSGIGVHPTNTAHLHIARYVAAGIKPLLGDGR